MALSVVAHVALVLIFSLQLSLTLPDPPKEEAVSVELVAPPKPPDTKKTQGSPSKKSQRQTAEQKVPPPPPARGAPPPPREQQAFQSGSQQTEMQEPEGAPPPPADTRGEPASARQAANVPVPLSRPPLSAATMALLRAKMADAQKPQAETAAPPAEKLVRPTEKPEKNAEETGKAAQSKDDAAKVDVERLETAQKHYSTKMLSDPRVKDALGQLPPNRRIVQICSIEALEQVRHARPDAFPDLLVPFSTGGGLIEGHALSAAGGAYRSQGAWYEIAYRCEVDAETTRVVSFRYELGGAVPRSEWSRRKLPAGT